MRVTASGGGGLSLAGVGVSDDVADADSLVSGEGLRGEL